MGTKKNNKKSRKKKDKPDKVILLVGCFLIKCGLDTKFETGTGAERRLNQYSYGWLLADDLSWLDNETNDIIYCIYLPDSFMEKVNQSLNSE